MSRRTHVPTGGRRQAWVMDDRTARTAVTALVGAGLLPVEATDRAVAELTVDAGTRRDRGPLVEVAAWLGAALVLAAAGLFLADGWSDLGRGGQAAALGGIAVLLAGAGLLARRPAHTRRLAGGLLSAAAVSLGFAVGLAVDAVVGTPWSDWPGVAGALTVAAAGALAHRLVPGVAAQLAVIAGLFAAVPSTFQLAGLDTEQWAWATEVALAGGWLLLAERGILSDRVVAVALGSSWALVGAQLPVDRPRGSGAAGRPGPARRGPRGAVVRARADQARAASLTPWAMARSASSSAATSAPPMTEVGRPAASSAVCRSRTDSWPAHSTTWSTSSTCVSPSTLTCSPASSMRS